MTDTQTCALNCAITEYLKGGMPYEAMDKLMGEVISRWRWPMRKRDDLSMHLRRCQAEILQALQAEIGVTIFERPDGTRDAVKKE